MFGTTAHFLRFQAAGDDFATPNHTWERTDISNEVLAPPPIPLDW